MRSTRGKGRLSRRKARGVDDEEEEEHHTSSGDAETESEEAAAIRLEMEQNEKQGEDDDDEEEEFVEAEDTMEVENSAQDEGFVDAEGQEEEEEEAEEEDEFDEEEQLPPKLDEGFYEIEFVRRKRVRKGQAQYLIKWRGWPETANTWEPIENLQACVDVVDAFEESLRSGSKGRKRKRRGSFTHPKKTQQQTPSSNVSGSRPGRKPKSLTSPSTENSKPSTEDAKPSTENAKPSTRPQRHRVASKSLYGERKGNGTNESEAKNVDANNVGTVAQQAEDQNGSSNYEIRQRACTDLVNSESGKVSIQIPDTRTSDKVESQRVELPRVDFDESIQSNRTTGARRRKSTNVKRFKNESSVSIVEDNAQNGDKLEADKLEAHMVVDAERMTRDNAADQRKAERLPNTCQITKIIKPVGYSASVSNDVQDVRVSFVAMSSDGREVVVDNKQLSRNNPQLLINFYEQHLRYSPPGMFPPA